MYGDATNIFSTTQTHNGETFATGSVLKFEAAQANSEHYKQVFKVITRNFEFLLTLATPFDKSSAVVNIFAARSFVLEASDRWILYLNVILYAIM